MKKENDLIIVLLVIIAIIAFAIFRQKSDSPKTENPITIPAGVSTATPTENPMTKQQYSQPPAMQLDAAKKYQAVLTTSAGELTIELDTINTPITANNFVFLAREGFYNNTVFHRIIEGFMIQGGDPTGTGAGGPGYRFADEPVVGEYTRGTIAMANAGPNTNGSQFFIMHQDYPLPPNYVIFGKVISGLETIDALATTPVTFSASGEQSQPIDPVELLSVEIRETE